MCSKDKWILVGECPLNVSFPRPIEINNNEIMTACSMDSSNYNNKNRFAGIWYYNISNCRWTHKIKYDSKVIKEISYHNITYNKNSNQIYLYGYSPPLYSINLITKKQTIYKKSFSVKGIHPLMICDNNNNIHLIGGDRKSHHFIWNPINNNSKCKLIYKFPQQHSSGAFIYLQKENKLMLLGGFDAVNSQRLDSIYTYNLNESKWIKLKTILPDKMNSFSYVLTENEQYLIILFGYNGNNYRNEINILNLTTMQFTKSKIIAPIGTNLYYSGSPQAFITYESSKNDILTIGYIKTININKIIPKAIIHIILSFHSTEFIHVIQRNKLKATQYKISIDAIFE